MKQVAQGHCCYDSNNELNEYEKQLSIKDSYLWTVVIFSIERDQEPSPRMSSCDKRGSATIFRRRLLERTLQILWGKQRGNQHRHALGRFFFSENISV